MNEIQKEYTEILTNIEREASKEGNISELALSALFSIRRIRKIFESLEARCMKLVKTIIPAGVYGRYELNIAEIKYATPSISYEDLTNGINSYFADEAEAIKFSKYLDEQGVFNFRASTKRYSVKLVK